MSKSIWAVGLLVLSLVVSGCGSGLGEANTAASDAANPYPAPAETPLWSSAHLQQRQK
jgi:hypothetical protein